MVMKQKVLLTILLASCFQVVKAQTEFAPIGATWYYSTYAMSANIGYDKVTSDRDTVIDGKKVKVLVREHHTSKDEIFFADNFYVYQTGDSVFYYLDGDFRLVYDFGLNVGDTMQIYASHNFCGDGSNYGYVIIDSITEVNVNGVKLKKFHSTKTDESDFGLQGPFVEILGATDGFFYPPCVADAAGEGIRDLRCYEDSTLGLFHYSMVDCDYRYFISDLLENENFNKGFLSDKIKYSNLDRSFSIEIPDECEFYEMQIFDMRGVCVWSDVYEGNVMNFTVPKCGVYVLVVKMGGQNYVEKIVAY